MSVRIVRAEREHAFVLAALTVQADREDGGSPREGFLREFADAWLADYERMPAWIALETDGSALGMVITSKVDKLPSLCRETTCWIHVKNVFVVPDRRGEGIAERMLRAMTVWGEHEKVERYQLNAEPKARGLYERLGFGAPPDRLMIKEVR